MSFNLTCSAFKDAETIPKKYTCDGADVSPPLHWNIPPAGTRSYVIIADDPDAPVGTWVHWVIYNVALDLRGLRKAFQHKCVYRTAPVRDSTISSASAMEDPVPRLGSHTATSSNCMR
jgi:Raf kinase inhibitor-like YbhB/YbcL family protein